VTSFQPVAAEDIAATIAWLAGRDIDDKAADAVVWDLMQPQPVTLGGVVQQFRVCFGTANNRRIALVISHDTAAGILTAHAFPEGVVAPVTILTSLMDMSIGVLIAFRRTCGAGLIAGMVASLGYMVGAAILTPDLWIEPLGALVKTGRAIVLMLVALLTLDNRQRFKETNGVLSDQPMAGRRRDPLRRRLRVLLALDPLRRRARRGAAVSLHRDPVRLRHAAGAGVRH
jgi:DoxX-like family